jgi:hypothetical protein
MTLFFRSDKYLQHTNQKIRIISKIAWDYEQDIIGRGLLLQHAIQRIIAYRHIKF